ncbi:hypothetical protein M1145_02400 [Patescibacteria group bacterium]|nr:hypothetical protein [Patescibacteria group bacterium]
MNRFFKNILFSFVLLFIIGLIFSNSAHASYFKSTATTPLPQETSNATSVQYNGYVYEIGGVHAALSTSSVYYSQMQFSGSLGSWNATTALPQALDSMSSVTYNGYIYVIGGKYNTASNINTPTTVPTVYYSQIQSNGSLGSWSTTTALPQAIYSSTSVEYNGFVYVIGGFSPFNVLNSSVYYSQIQPNGSLGSWNMTTSIYESVPTFGIPEPIYGATSVVSNGYIYEIGGDSNANLLSLISYAPINNNGTLGSWTNTYSLPQKIMDATSVIYNGYIYSIGGQTSTSGLTSNVYSINTKSLRNGYSILGSNGNIYYFGTANYGDMNNIPNGVPSKKSIGFAQTPGDLGYYILTSDGGIYTFGNAKFFGSVYNIPNAPVKTPVAIATTTNGLGYYVLTADGGVYTFGNAQFYGSLYNIPSSAIPDRTPIAFGVTPNGGGYYIVTQNGSVYTFGNAVFHGSIYNIPNVPVRTTVAFSLTPNGNGYYLVTKDGGVYTFGSAQFQGSMYNIPNPPVRTPVAFKLSSNSNGYNGEGYYIITADGGVYTFGHANFLGAITSLHVTPVSVQ